MASSDDLFDMLRELDDNRDTDTEKPVSSKPQATATTHDLATTLLEATVQAQTAAELAQVATERCVHLNKEQKESLIEMSEALGAWRHATRSALKELKKEQKKSTLMLALTALLAASTLGGGGFMLYQVKKQVELGKADILDLMQTQMAVQSQSTQLKLDELASTIESLQHSLKQELQQLTLAQNSATPVEVHSHTLQTAPDTHPSETTETNQLPVMTHAEKQVTTAAITHSKYAEAHTEQISSTNEHVNDDTARWERLEQAVEQLRQQLAQLEQKISQGAMQPNTRAAQTHHTETTPDTLAALQTLLQTQQKDLKVIRSALWKLRQQQRTTTPSSTMDAQTLKQINTTLQHLSKQIEGLKTQQQQMQRALQTLKTHTQTLLKNQGYSYKAPPLEVD